MTSAAQGVDVLGEGQAGPRGRPVPPALGQAVWQTILRADGYLGTNHSVAVDCSFGADTLAATRQWQKDHGLVADWVARPKTFTKAGQYLRADDTNIYGEDVINYDSPGPRCATSPTATRTGAETSGPTAGSVPPPTTPAAQRRDVVRTP